MAMEGTDAFVCWITARAFGFWLTPGFARWRRRDTPCDFQLTGERACANGVLLQQLYPGEQLLARFQTALRLVLPLTWQHRSGTVAWDHKFATTLPLN